MSQTASLFPPNSLLFISDVDGDEPIDFTNMKTIMSNDTCVVVWCLPFVDGQTEILLGTAREVDPGWAPAFDGVLITKKRTVVVSTSEREVILKSPTKDARTRVKVWINSEEEPDKVIVGVSED